MNAKYAFSGAEVMLQLGSNKSWGLQKKFWDQFEPKISYQTDRNCKNQVLTSGPKSRKEC